MFKLHLVVEALGDLLVEVALALRVLLAHGRLLLLGVGNEHDFLGNVNASCSVQNDLSNAPATIYLFRAGLQNRGENRGFGAPCYINVKYLMAPTTDGRPGGARKSPDVCKRKNVWLGQRR